MPVVLTHLLARLRTLRRERHAATAIEFAAVAAPFIALLLATMQTSLVFFSQQCLETVSEETARQILTGAVRSSNTSIGDFHQLACNNLPAFMNCANLMVDVQNADTFAEVDTVIPSLLDKDGKEKTKDDWQFNTGGAGKIVVMRTMYLLPVVGGPLGFSLSNTSGSRRLIVATAVFKSEPYDS